MFEHPEQVPWRMVASVLTALFKENTGRGLDQDHLDYLARIAFSEYGSYNVTAIAIVNFNTHSRLVAHM